MISSGLRSFERPRDRLQARDQAATGGAAGEVAGEEDDAGDPTLTDRGSQSRPDRGAVEADHDALAGELLQGQGFGNARLRRRGPVPEGGAERERRDRQAGEGDQGHPSPPRHSSLHDSILGVRAAS
jgi:hypothetical protein